MNTLLAVLYGQMGVGKSTDMVAAFPLACHFCRPGGLLSSWTYLGLDAASGLAPITRAMPDGDWSGFVFQSYYNDLEQAIAQIDEAVALGFVGICVDDVSLASEATEYGITKALADPDGTLRKGNVFRKFDIIKERVYEVRQAARFAGTPCVMTAHERDPSLDFKTKDPLPGGPKFPTKKLTESIPYDADLVLRFVRGEDGSRMFDRRDNKYAFKDRFAVVPPVGPANLRALLFASGTVLPRFPGLEWQDEVMTHVAARMERGDERNDVVHETFAAVAKNDKHMKHIAWSVRDGLALHSYQEFVRERWINDLISPAGAGVGGDSAHGGGRGTIS